MDFITNVLCRLLLLTDSSTNFYVPASKNLRLLPSNVSSVSDFCLAPLHVKEDSNLAIDLPEDTDLLSQLNASETCKTPACIEAAANILSNIDETVKPCDDFYQFACGGWMKRYVNDFMSLQELGYVSRKKMRVIFEKKLNGDQREFVRQMKVFYDTCMNQKNIPRAGVKLLKKVLKDLGGWPIIKGEKWNSSSFDWIDAVGRISQLKANLYFFVTLSVVVDPRNNSFQIIK
ncbi:membrane metallo-endopeptidase-like 1, partial [Stegodyphus dumicola]|uniref:membrane metallo-endopeptidase-like 1 n=1 Tax=Stegodyphus dumicola TaxID=202533 RepID=UPI0015AA9D67